jgi:hypothetical protein
MTTRIPELFARLTKLALSVAAIISLSATALQASHAPRVVPPLPLLYRAWSAAWWEWGLEHPLEGHPFVDDPAFEVSSGQRGPVWFLATPLGTVERTVTIPFGKFLFVGLLNAEASDLEGLGATRAERRETAIWLADHIGGVRCEVDGVAIPAIDSYRVTSPQFAFDAPTPWIFGDTGGRGKSVADGYYIMLAPLSRGTHTIRVTGAFHFSVAEGDPFDFDATADVTYYITVQ